MEDPQDLICVVHVAHPSVPATVLEAIGKAREYPDNDKSRERRMLGDYNVGNYANGGRNVGDATTAEYHVDAIDDEGGADVADNWGEENEGDLRVGKLVVCFKLKRVEKLARMFPRGLSELVRWRNVDAVATYVWNQRSVRSIVHAHDDEAQTSGYCSPNIDPRLVPSRVVRLLWGRRWGRRAIDRHFVGGRFKGCSQRLFDIGNIH